MPFFTKMTAIASWILMVGAPANAGGAPEGIQVKLISVHESRAVQIVKPKPVNGWSGFTGFVDDNSLTLTIELSGAELAHATHYGKFRVDGAKDDKARPIGLHPEFTSGLTDLSESFEKIDREMMYIAEPEPPTDRIKFDLKLTMPARDAKRILIPRGSVAVRMGKKQEVVVPHVRELVGKRIAEPALAKAGLTVMLAEPGSSGFLMAGEPNRTISFSVVGDPENLLSVALVDAAGTPISTASMWSQEGSSTAYTLMADQDVPVDAGLKLQVAIDSKVVDIPFALPEFELP